MPVISMFYGIIIQLLFYDNKEHNHPHIHAKYGEFAAAFDIETADILAGTLPSRQTGSCKPGLKSIEMSSMPTGNFRLMVMKYLKLSL
ncbi:MAG: DUF4160 domain-containing protein [Chlorobium sp.]